MPRTHLYKGAQKCAVAALALAEGKERRHRSLLAAYIEWRARPRQHGLVDAAAVMHGGRVEGIGLGATEGFTHSPFEANVNCARLKDGSPQIQIFCTHAC